MLGTFPNLTRHRQIQLAGFSDQTDVHLRGFHQQLLFVPQFLLQTLSLHLQLYVLWEKVKRQSLSDSLQHRYRPKITQHDITRLRHKQLTTERWEIVLFLTAMSSNVVTWLHFNETLDSDTTSTLLPQWDTSKHWVFSSKQKFPFPKRGRCQVSSCGGSFLTSSPEITTTKQAQGFCQSWRWSYARHDWMVWDTGKEIITVFPKKNC